jgi:hypothetical protein
MSRSQSTFSPEPHFAQQLNVLQQQSPISTYNGKRCHKNSSAQAGKEEVERKLTSQHLAGGFDNAKNERFALFTMNNPCHQTEEIFFI